MFRSMFTKRPTTKVDVLMAVAAAVAAVWKASDTLKDYKAEQELGEIEETK